MPIQIYRLFCLPKFAFISEYVLAGIKRWVRCWEVQGPALLFLKSMHWVSKNLVTLGKLLSVVKWGYSRARLPHRLLHTWNVTILFVNYTSIKMKNKKEKKPPRLLYTCIAENKILVLMKHPCIYRFIVYHVPGIGDTKSVMAWFLMAPSRVVETFSQRIITHYVGAKIEGSMRCHWDVMDGTSLVEERVGSNSQTKFLEEVIPENMDLSNKNWFGKSL